MGVFFCRYGCDFCGTASIWDSHRIFLGFSFCLVYSVWKYICPWASLRVMKVSLVKLDLRLYKFPSGKCGLGVYMTCRVFLKFPKEGILGEDVSRSQIRSVR